MSANASPIPALRIARRYRLLAAIRRQPPEEQKQLFLDEKYRRIKQAHALGMQYYCFNCLKSCPVGQG
jgi:hypothetical protein